MAMRRSLGAALLAALAFSCGPRTEEAPPAPSGAAAPRAGRISEPRVLEQVDPDFSEETAQFLVTSNATLRVVFHIAVREDGTLRHVEVVRAEPADLPIARKFAEEVAASMPRWRFASATLDGKPVDAEFDFTMEAQAGPEEP